MRLHSFLFAIAAQYALIGEIASWVPYFSIAFLVTIYLVAFIFRPVGYVITAERLIIQKQWKNVELNRSEIEQVELLEEGRLKGSIRTFGVGGLFGYFGKFTKIGFGNMTWYATRRNKMVLIQTTGNKKIVVTPDEAELFVAGLNRLG